jgi:site-specific recombinase XerD
LLAATGMHRQEVVDLKREKVDFNNKTIQIYEKVNNKERLFPHFLLPINTNTQRVESPWIFITSHQIGVLERNRN